MRQEDPGPAGMVPTPLAGSRASAGRSEAPVGTPGRAGDLHKDFLLQAPSISLPKGGGAIRGIGEKFSANPVTGTGSMSVPIATSPGRSGFGPQLSLSYDSGAGNGPFGLGWSLSLPSITRKTDKGLPRYLDSVDSDTFLLAGAEDLVPELDAHGQPVVGQLVSVYGGQYRVRRYRPRIEGLFALMECWRQVNDPTNVFWRTISRDNVTSWFGRSEESRVLDPEDRTRVYQWLLCETHDDKGNVAIYQYKPEDGARVDRNQAFEANRTARNRHAATYIHRIAYGNRVPYMPTLPAAGVGWADPPDQPDSWMFEVLFDYGEYAALSGTRHPELGAAGTWPVRSDPFSTHRAGFEVRTWRLCHRVLMVHHFAGEATAGSNCLVKSTDFIYEEPAVLADPSKPGYTVLREVKQRSYQRRPDPLPAAGRGYEWRELPPVTFSYSKPRVDTRIQSIAARDLPNLPVGTQGPGYQWVDLDGEGLSGVLSKHSGSWRYAPNRGGGRFGPTRVVAKLPAGATFAGGQQNLMDIDGDGEIDLVDFSGPMPGFHERDRDDGWKRHVPFASLPNLDWQDPNLRFVDLTGDGHADALITENEIHTWYPSLEERGFGGASRQHVGRDEEAAPRLVFDDGTQTIFLADMCGDGLTDLVRIRNGQICYWPNLGYGRFGRKVTIANASRFDAPDLFDPQRIRLVDIDGSGPIDIIYMGRAGAQLYFNRSGNSLSNALLVPLPMATENLGSVQAADLLGTGTACLVWNSHLPADASHPVRYVQLMAEGKPHLLRAVDNNLGARTEITYTPSTEFYLRDLADGRPWITRLPFPVHCVSKVTAYDDWRGTAFSNTYSYHHGYFDGHEREFRGFGRVEQTDLDQFGSDGNTDSPYVTNDRRLFQPPVKTVTWYHTGAALDRQRILSQFAQEYFPARYASRLPTAPDAFRERPLPEPELPAGLSSDEWREALRACKGMVLRQETYELDLEDLVGPIHRHVPVRLYSVATHNCQIQLLQPRGTNAHAVFLVTESEALTYQHELPIPQGAAALAPDPRIAHTLNLRHDRYGNAEQSVAIGYPRWAQVAHTGRPRPELITSVQSEWLISYAETRYTNDVYVPARELDTTSPLRHHRLRVPCEARNYQLTGLQQPANRYFDIATLRRHQLCEDPTLYPATGPATEQVTLSPLQYHQQPLTTGPHRRVVEHARTLYFDDADDAAPPAGALAHGQLGPRGLKYEDFKLALTDALLTAVFADKLAWEAEPATTSGAAVTCRQLLDTQARSGYVRGDTSNLGGRADEYWMRSGIAGFADDAHQHFFLPERYTDPFGAITTLRYDARDLFVVESRDARGNATLLDRFDFRVMAPIELVDVNGNHTEVAYDILGLVVAMAVKGKRINTRWQFDHLDAWTFDHVNTPPAEISAFCLTHDFQPTHEQTARDWLSTATARIVYHFGDSRTGQGSPQWKQRMAGACAIARETHLGKLGPGKQTRLQISLECSDGSGAVLMKKIQAEAATASPATRRWLVNGLTLLNNKGKPVKQYEPVFSPDFGCEMPQANGVSTTMFYDAAGRLVRTEMPDGTFSKVEFSPWFSRSFDANDTVMESRWYRERGRNALNPGSTVPTPLVVPPPHTADNRAGWLAAQHANTWAETHFDSLGREVIAIAHNRTPGANGIWTDERHLTFTKLDAEGKPLWIRDARGNLVMQYVAPHKPTRLADDPGEEPWFTETATQRRVRCLPCYDLAGNLLHQHSMDAGDRWMLVDASGQPLLAWDLNDKGPGTPMQRRLYLTDYDSLHRPVAHLLKLDDAAPALIETFEYEDNRLYTDANFIVTDQTGLDRAQARNVLGQAVWHRDPSGLAGVERIDISGQPAHVTRRLIRAGTQGADGVVNWAAGDSLLEPAAETFHQITDLDALGRMTRLFNWHRDLTFDASGGATFTKGATNRVAVYMPNYNARGLLQAESLHVRASKSSVDGAFTFVPNLNTVLSAEAIRGVTYNAKGQKEELQLGKGTTTTYTYDNQTYRLTHLATRRATDNKALQKVAYVYDAVGNITHIHDEAQETVHHQNSVIRPEHDYRYDALYRLIEATGRENTAAAAPPPRREGPWPQGVLPTDHVPRNYTQRYVYDAVGNFLRMEHDAGTNAQWTRHYTTHPDSNRLASTWYGSTSSEAISYRHDAHGSMLNLNRLDFDAQPPNPPIAEDEKWGRQIQWDWRDMTHRFDAIGGGVAQYHYGMDKRRTRKHIVRIGGGLEDRIYLSGYELYRRRSPSGGMVEEIESHQLFEGEECVLLVDDVLLARDQPGPSGTSLLERTCWRYQYLDHLGSVGLELDEAARIISHEEFHPYGTSAYRLVTDDADMKAPAKRYRYSGMERDEESGLSMHAARQLATWLGRWLTTDPLGIEAGLNDYLYCSSSPVCKIDRSGTWELPYDQDEQNSLSPDSNLVNSEVGKTVRRAAGGSWGALGNFFGFLRLGLYDTWEFTNASVKRKSDAGAWFQGFYGAVSDGRFVDWAAEGLSDRWNMILALESAGEQFSAGEVFGDTAMTGYTAARGTAGIGLGITSLIRSGPRATAFSFRYWATTYDGIGIRGVPEVRLNFERGPNSYSDYLVARTIARHTASAQADLDAGMWRSLSKVQVYDRMMGTNWEAAWRGNAIEAIVNETLALDPAFDSPDFFFQGRLNVNARGNAMKPDYGLVTDDEIAVFDITTVRQAGKVGKYVAASTAVDVLTDTSNPSIGPSAANLVHFHSLLDTQ